MCYNIGVMSSKIPPLLKGFRDFGPEKMTARLVMLEKIRQTFERFCFEPMETPALEYAQTLTGKYGAEEKLMYQFRDQGGRVVAMRYDLTVPLARFYSANKNNLPKPFKRYQIGPVWRAESPQKGRFREFYQCDVDIVGSQSAVADAEAIAVISTALADLGVENIAIRVNNRKLLDGILEMLKVPRKKRVMVMRLLDKLDKLPEKTVRTELQKSGLEKNQVTKLFKLLNLSATDAKGLQDGFREILLENKMISEGAGEISDVLDALQAMEVKNVMVDLKLARGLDYYTGTVCEVVFSELPNIGSVAGGGRYDNLIGEFSGTKEKIPAVGMSIGIDRLITALEELGLIKYDTVTDAIVFNLDRRNFDVYLRVVSQLRQAGINCDFYYETVALDKQFKYAEKKKINFAVIIGEDEIKKGVVTLKNLVTRKQWQVKAQDLIGELQKRLLDN